MIPMTIVWLVLAVIFAIVEAGTVGLTAIWFSLGSLAAMIAAFITDLVWVHIIVLILVSGVSLYFTRGLAKKYVNNRHERTNLDRVVGQEAIVTEDIDNTLATGSIRVGGLVWTARSVEGNIIASGQRVVIDAIEGVKAMVSVKKEDISE